MPPRAVYRAVAGPSFATAGSALARAPGLGPALDRELAVDVVDVFLDRADRDHERIGDRLIGMPGGDQAEHSRSRALNGSARICGAGRGAACCSGTTDDVAQRCPSPGRGGQERCRIRAPPATHGPRSAPAGPHGRSLIHKDADVALRRGECQRALQVCRAACGVALHLQCQRAQRSVSRSRCPSVRPPRPRPAARRACRAWARGRAGIAPPLGNRHPRQRQVLHLMQVAAPIAGFEVARRGPAIAAARSALCISQTCARTAGPARDQAVEERAPRGPGRRTAAAFQLRPACIPARLLQPCQREVRRRHDPPRRPRTCRAPRRYVPASGASARIQIVPLAEQLAQSGVIVPLPTSA